MPHTETKLLLQRIVERVAAALDGHTCSLLLREKNGISDALEVQPLAKKESVTVQGRERQFDLSEALDPTTNARYRLIEGTVESIMGRPVFIGLRYKVDAETPTTDRLPDDVRKMLESIK